MAPIYISVLNRCMTTFVTLETEYELTGRDRSRDDRVFFFLSTTSPRSIISECIIFLIEWRLSLSSGFFPIWIKMLRYENMLRKRISSANCTMFDCIPFLFDLKISVRMRLRTFTDVIDVFRLLQWDQSHFTKGQKSILKLFSIFYTSAIDFEYSFAAL